MYIINSIEISKADLNNTSIFSLKSVDQRLL